MFRIDNHQVAPVAAQGDWGRTFRSRGPSSWRYALLALTLSLVTTTTAFAQGRQTGTIMGSVTDGASLVIPGATVTISSPALQGLRTTTTDGNGNFTLPGLPPGEYNVRVELAGMRSVDVRQRVDLGLTARVDAQLQLDSLTETVTVTSTPPSVVTAVSAGANYRAEMIDKLNALIKSAEGK